MVFSKAYFLDEKYKNIFGSLSVKNTLVKKIAQEMKNDYEDIIFYKEKNKSFKDVVLRDKIQPALIKDSYYNLYVKGFIGRNIVIVPSKYNRQMPSKFDIDKNRLIEILLEIFPNEKKTVLKKKSIVSLLEKLSAKDQNIQNILLENYDIKTNSYLKSKKIKENINVEDILLKRDEKIIVDFALKAGENFKEISKQNKVINYSIFEAIENNRQIDYYLSLLSNKYKTLAFDEVANKEKNRNNPYFSFVENQKIIFRQEILELYFYNGKYDFIKFKEGNKTEVFNLKSYQVFTQDNNYTKEFDFFLKEKMLYKISMIVQEDKIEEELADIEQNLNEKLAKINIADKPKQKKITL